jgi:hypothetical protein
MYISLRSELKFLNQIKNPEIIKIYPTEQTFEKLFAFQKEIK